MKEFRLQDYGRTDNSAYQLVAVGKKIKVQKNYPKNMTVSDLGKNCWYGTIEIY